MIVWLLRGLARLVALVVLVVLGVAAGATVVGAAISADGIDRIADAATGPERRADATSALDSVATSSATDTTGVLVGGAALLGGLLVAVGCVAPARRKLLLVEGTGAQAPVSARPKAVAAAARAVAEDVPGVQRARAKVSGRRRRQGGTLRVRARSAPGREPKAVGESVTSALQPLAEGLGLRAKVATRTAGAPSDGPERTRVR